MFPPFEWQAMQFVSNTALPSTAMAEAVNVRPTMTKIDGIEKVIFFTKIVLIFIDIVGIRLISSDLEISRCQEY